MPTSDAPTRARSTRPRIHVVVAVARNGVIGRDGDLPWRLPADLAHFKRLTTGHVIVMGRKTFESLGRPLPNRTHLVVSRTPREGDTKGVSAPAEASTSPVHWFTSLDEALTSPIALARTDLFVIGGGELYRQALPLADDVHLTEVDANVEGDTTFPALPEHFHEVAREPHAPDERNPLPYTFVRYERRATR
jgi:dihydrofolate reductase